MERRGTGPRPLPPCSTANNVAPLRHPVPGRGALPCPQHPTGTAVQRPFCRSPCCGPLQPPAAGHRANPPLPNPRCRHLRGPHTPRVRGLGAPAGARRSDCPVPLEGPAVPCDAYATRACPACPGSAAGRASAGARAAAFKAGPLCVRSHDRWAGRLGAPWLCAAGVSACRPRSRGHGGRARPAGLVNAAALGRG